MNTQEITINNISSRDLIHALTFMPNRNDIIALLFNLMDEYADSPSNTLMRRWFTQDIEMTDLINEIFKFLEPVIPMSADMIELDFSQVDTISFYSRYSTKSITVTMVDGTSKTIRGNNQAYPAYRDLIDAEIDNRRLIRHDDNSSSSWSSSTSVYYFQVDTESKLSEAQTRAMATLLKAVTEVDLGQRDHVQTYFSNSEISKVTVKALSRRGLIRRVGEHRYASQIELTDEGLDLAKKIAPQATVSGVQDEQAKLQAEIQLKTQITNQINRHYTRQISTPSPFQTSVKPNNLYRHNGIGDMTFTVTHHFTALEGYSERETARKIEIIVRAGQGLVIVSKKGYAGLGKYSSDVALEIPASEVYKFSQLVVQATALLQELNTSEFEPYTGELLSFEI